MTYTVLAGKYDGFDENCKYVEDFATLEEASAAWKRVNDYPWSRIEDSQGKEVEAIAP